MGETGDEAQAMKAMRSCEAKRIVLGPLDLCWQYGRVVCGDAAGRADADVQKQGESSEVRGAPTCETTAALLPIEELSQKGSETHRA